MNGQIDKRGCEFTEIRFGGSGGQGVILMGVILATSAVLDGCRVVQTQSYGPEARGGYSRSDVIISGGVIDYPQLQGADILVTLSLEAALRYLPMLRDDGYLIYDSVEIPNPPRDGGKQHGFPFSRLAQEHVGRPQTANVLTLGAVAELTGVVSLESLEAAVESVAPAGTSQVNRQALEVGARAARGELES